MGHVGLEGDIGQMGLRQVDVEVQVAKEGIGYVGASGGLEKIFHPRLLSEAVGGRLGWVTPSLDPSESETFECSSVDIIAQNDNHPPSQHIKGIPHTLSLKVFRAIFYITNNNRNLFATEQSQIVITRW